MAPSRAVRDRIGLSRRSGDLFLRSISAWLQDEGRSGASGLGRAERPRLLGEILGPAPPRSLVAPKPAPRRDTPGLVPGRARRPLLNFLDLRLGKTTRRI